MVRSEEIALILVLNSTVFFLSFALARNPNCLGRRSRRCSIEILDSRNSISESSEMKRTVKIVEIDLKIPHFALQFLHLSRCFFLSNGHRKQLASDYSR